MKTDSPEDIEKRKIADGMMEQARRLVDAGRYAEALPIAQRVNAQLPARGDALQMLGMLYSKLGDPYRALEKLVELLALRQGDPRTLYHLAEVYLQTGCPVHAMRSLRRLADYWGSDRSLRDLPDPRPLIERIDASMTSEIGLAGLDRDHQEVAMMAAERGRLRLLFQGDTARAAREFRLAIKVAPLYPQARNNLSLTYFLDGRSDKAMSSVLEVLQLHPENVFALATLAFYRYAAGAAAGECLPLARRAAALLGREPRRPDLIKVAEVLHILGDDATCEQALLSAPPPERLLGAAVDGSEITRLALLAASLANQGRDEAAQDVLRSEAITVHDRFATRLLTAIMAGERPHGAARYPGVSWDLFVSAGVLAGLAAPPARPGALLLGRRQRSPSPRQLPAALGKLYPRLVEACAIMLWLSEKHLEDLAVTLLSIADTPPAVQLLREHLAGSLGSYSGRQDAGYALLDNGHLENGTVVRFWMGTEWGQLQIFRLAPKARDLDALAAKLYELAEKVRNG